MAQILNPTMTATKLASGDNWRINVTYTAQFSEFEIKNFRYRDGFVLWEDDPFDNDQLTGVVSVSTFDPSTQSVVRNMQFTISGDTLDTELGQEELFSVVRLRNLDLNILLTRKTNTLH